MIAEQVDTLQLTDETGEKWLSIDSEGNLVAFNNKLARQIANCESHVDLETHLAAKSVIAVLDAAGLELDLYLRPHSRFSINDMIKNFGKIED